MQNVQKIPIMVLATFISLFASAQINNNNGPGDKSLRIGGIDNNLYLSANDITETRKGKYIFQYYIDDNNNISLRGWKAHGLHGRKFRPNYNLSLVNGPQDPEDGYAKGDTVLKRTYFGDLVVTRGGIRKLKKILKEGFQTVIFSPVQFENTEFTAYKIYVSKNNLLFPAKASKGGRPPRDAQNTNLMANPSPPRGFDNY